MNQILIVGGGMVGIFAALKLADHFESVYIIEKAPHLGGLLNSRKINQVSYDYGTHIPAFTVEDEVNEILFNEVNSINGLTWNEYPYLEVANYFMGHWNNESTLLDIRNLSKDLYVRATTEMLASGRPDYTKNNLKEFLNQTFGGTITENIYRPVIRKILGEELENVSPEVLLQYSLHRIMAFNSEKTRELKRDTVIDSKLGFHSYKEYPPSRPYLYPKGNEGVGKWVSSLEKQLKIKNVKILLSNGVTNIVKKEGRFQVNLESGELPTFNDIIWTVPVAMAYRALDIPIKSTIPRFRYSTLVNLGFDQSFLRDNHYVLIWDPEILAFRITLYPNLTKLKESVYHCSVEILSGSTIEDKPELLKRVLKDLQVVGLVSPEANLVESEIIDIGPAFPVPSTQFRRSVDELNDKFEQLHPEILLLGKASGKNFLLNDTLIHANSVLNKHFSN